MARHRLTFLAVLLLLTPSACDQQPTAATTGVVPRFNHVFIVVEENTDYADVIGGTAMVYLDSLAHEYGLATQYYGDAHPSIGNYFMMTVGDTITDNDGYSSIVTADNIVRRLVAAGKTWKSYAEDLPSVGYTGGDVGNYARKHNVIALLSDVVNDPAQTQNLVPFTQFAVDLAGHVLPNYAFIATNIDPLVRSADFRQDGLLIVTFDEAGGDNTHGGGRVAWVAVSAKSKRAYQSTTLYRHESTLRLSAKVLGLTTFPNHAASAPDMAEFFEP